MTETRRPRRGIIGYGTYVPYYRLQRSAITDALGTGGGRGTRAVASFDEDATSMAVEAARRAVRNLEANGSPFALDALYFATATPPYLDKTNANVIHAALDLPSAVFAADMVGSSRSLGGALRAAMGSPHPTMVASADLRSGRPGSTDEASTGDAGVALIFGNETDAPVLAEPIASASATAEFLDRWRLPAWNYSRQWEERFGEHAYLPLVTEAVDAALKQAELEPSDLDLVLVTGLHARAVRGAVAAAGLGAVTVGDDLVAVLGNTGTPHLGVVLASALDRAEPNQTIMTIHLADGADVGVFRTTDALANYTNGSPVATQLGSGTDGLDYNTFLTWRGFLDREPPRRPDPVAPAAPPSLRSQRWKYGFVGSRDESSGAIHLPPQRVSVKGGAVDEMEPVPMADVPATVVTFTIDRLAYSLSPPVVAVVIDFDGGGRFQCQLTDVNPDDVSIGDRVTMTFRKLSTAEGVHNYFWKARPAA